MRKAIPLVVLVVSIAVAGTMPTAAQETSTMPKLLQLQREFVKPGKGGPIHDKSESAFVEAMARAKWPTHYIALQSMSGKNRVLYLTAYDSYAAWQKDSEAVGKNAALNTAIDKAIVADADLLDSTDSAVLSYREDLSYRPRPDLTNQHYMEIVVYHIRPGFGREWADETKAVIEAHRKAGTNANWGMYQLDYGGNGSEYVLLSADADLAEIDTGDAEGKKFRDAMGDDGMKKLQEVTRTCIASTETQLFSINPKQSYPPDAWVKANPDFWKPKPTMSMPAKPAADAKKPAGQ